MSAARTYDYLVLATGVRHSYFGHYQFEKFAPGLKSLADAVGICNRILRAFERAAPSVSLLVVSSCVSDPTNAAAGDIRLIGCAGTVHPMRYLSAEEQVFVLYQIRNWLLGRQGAFKLLNDA